MTNPKKINRPVKSFEISYDEVSERFVLEIFDKEAMFPLLIKAESIDSRVLIVTQNQRLHLT